VAQLSRKRGAALVTPLSGPLALFGRAGATGLQLWAEQVAATELSVFDAHPDPVAALAAAERDRPDLLFGPYGSGPALAVARAASRLVWNHGAATGELTRSAFPTVVNVLAPAATYFTGALDAVRSADEAARRVVILSGAGGFAREVAGGAARRARLHGMVVTVGTLGATVADLPEADVLLVAGRFEEEVAAAPALLDRPWRAAGFVGAGVEEVLAVLEARREGLVGPAQWVDRVAPAPDEGPDAAWFVRRYRQRVGVDPPYPAAQSFAAGVIAGRCARDVGGTDDAELLAAARALSCTTLLGAFRLDPTTGLQVGHRVLTVQWQDGDRWVVWPPEQAERALVYPRPVPETWPFS
jgi:branched-chain amino acid transport system substrate-binding protein